MPRLICVPCQTAQPAHSENLIESMTATQQYVLLGLRWKKCATPFLFVFSMSKGVPGRGLDVFFGVDSSTGMCGCGVPRIVTRMAAFVIDGLG